MDITTLPSDLKDLKSRYEDLKAAEPKLRARDLASRLGVSEADLLAARVGEGVTRLRPEPQDILKAIKPLGEVMALTRNESCVHERKGVYDNASFFEQGKMKHGLFVNPDIDLRLFMSHWGLAFAVEEPGRAGLNRSIQFFDKAGDALHKIYLTNKSDEEAYQALVREFAAEDQHMPLELTAYSEKRADRPDAEIDAEALRTHWTKLKDTHDFYPMLMKYKVGRIQALRLAGEDKAYRVENSASRQVLEMARDREVEIMVFVGNRGCIQIHTGPVNKLMDYETWVNVMDPKFNLHLNEDKIAQSWVTLKPTVDGIVTALEVYGHDNELIVTFFGKRKPGIPELESWRGIVADLPKA